MNVWEPDRFILFLIFIVPGFLASKTYSLLFPFKFQSSSEKIIDAICYSCINYVLLYPFIHLVESNDLQAKFPVWYLLFYFFVVFIAPILIVSLWGTFRKSDIAQKQFNLPHPTQEPWDFVFGKKSPYWVLVTLKNGNQIAGAYSVDSFTSNAPSEESIYLEERWDLKKDGAFDKPVNDSNGIIVLKSEISTVEFFKYGDLNMSDKKKLPLNEGYAPKKSKKPIVNNGYSPSPSSGPTKRPPPPKKNKKS